MRRTKGEQTRAAIAEAALPMFREHDTSPGRAKTDRLIDSTAALAERLIRAARLPALRS